MRKKYLKFAKEAREITAHFQTRLIICEYFKIAKEIKADGVYIEDSGFSTINVIENLYSWQIVGASANNIQDCKNLLSKNVDYICLNPFKDQENKGNNTITELGLNGFTTIIDVLNTKTTIIGSGGITISNLSSILETGISGIAVSNSITRNFDSIKEFNTILNASSTKEKRYTL
ncbi:thiamine phosphate synthase [Polaribacter ponticola]|uniref:thiamine phosphate synthase n=1 Tax=Polaribacter ponticola TaxID=2978475 RepID=UPI0030823EA8